MTRPRRLPPTICAFHLGFGLVALYNATDGDNWRGKDNWLTDYLADTWFGVTADGDGCVIQLVLEWNQLSGEMPPELGSLASLYKLGLSYNQLSGEIPPELGDLANLEEFYLHGNQLSGCVPSSLQGQLDRTYTDLGGLPFC